MRDEDLEIRFRLSGWGEERCGSRDEGLEIRVLGLAIYGL